MRRLSCSLLLLLACEPDAEERGDNRCESTAACPAPSECSLEHGLCALDEPTIPYRMVLQVSNLGERAAGLRHYTFEAETLERTRSDRNLDVEAGVTVEGNVLGSGAAGGPVFAEVTFTLQGEQNGRVTPPVVVTTGSDANLPFNLSATLAPGLPHDVAIYPLGAQSALLPPARTIITPGQPFSFTYPELDELSGWLFDENETPRGGLWLRVLAGERRTPSDLPDEYQPEQVVSSLAIVGANQDGSDEDGLARFVLKVLPRVLGERDYVVQVNLSAERPWSTTVELDASRIESAVDGRVYIPAEPARVHVENWVRTELGEAAAEANLVFESTYQVPTTPGTVNDRDWCRARRLGDRGTPFRCRTRITASTGGDGKFVLDLLPGDYKMYISPNREAETTRLKMTSGFAVTVETRPGGGAQTGQIHELRLEAKRVIGSVQGFHGPMPDALIRLLPLGGIAVTDVEAYNRSSDAVSDGRGEFIVPSDLGFFDIVARAPEGSGYASVYNANRHIVDDLPVGAYVLPPPVLVSGVVTVAGQVAPGARVDAYALVRALRQPGRTRGALIGSAVADTQGRYTLLLPPAVDDEPR
jgi:hypothetical protein